MHPRIRSISFHVLQYQFKRETKQNRKLFLTAQDGQKLFYRKNFSVCYIKRKKKYPDFKILENKKQNYMCI